MATGLPGKEKAFVFKGFYQLFGIDDRKLLADTATRDCDE